MEASQIVNTVGGAASGIASMTGVGSWLAPIISLATTGIGAGLQAGEAKKQQEQAAKEREQANKLKPNLLQPEYWKKYHMDRMSALSNMPDYENYIENLANNSANQMRAIRESSPTGAATLAAISALHNTQNESLNKLAATNASYKVAERDKVSADLAMLGAKKDEQQAIADQKKALMYQQAGALENASTYNKQSAWNNILGGISSTATQLTKNIGDNNNANSFNDLMNSMYGSGTADDGYGNRISVRPPTKTPNPNLFNQNIWGANNYQSQLGMNTNTYIP